MGLDAFNHLPVLAFAIDPDASEHLTPHYGYNLATNFRPPNDYRAAIDRIHKPASVLVGGKDEVFVPTAYARVFNEANPKIDVNIVQGLSHVGLTLEPEGTSAVVERIAAFGSERSGRER